MLIKIIVVGKLKDRFMQERCDEYLKWIGPYAKTEVVTLADSTVEKEGQAIAKALEKERNSCIFILSEEGKQFTSVELAQTVGKIDRKLVFVIGGPFGLAPEAKACANTLWSLSKLTLTHEMARLLLCEQLFRAISINNGSGYHNP